ncbi:MAG: mechanosensitive ion channel family protein [Ignavibacteriaceae bacterium]|nr:mechanosensitive ion channel family protein [Ignavibacteriaceae bacterium]
MQNFLNQSYYGNSVAAYLTALGIFIISILLIKIFKKIILGRLKKWATTTETTLDDYLVRGIERTLIPLLYFLSLYAGIKSLNLDKKIEKYFDIISIIIFTFFFLRAVSSIITHLLKAFVAKRGADEQKQKQLKGISSIISFVIWTLGFVFALDNLGFKVSAVIAGLGIGGIAIALAAQAILGDLFSYFVILFDRPFEIGDFISVADKSGNIEHIGIKTTRIRSLSGEQLIISNTDLTNSRIHNFKRLEKRRVVFKLGVVYQTKAELLKEIPEIVKKIITEEPKTQFDRGHFATFGDFSLIFEFVYFILDQEYTEYMKTQQNINFKIYEEFEKRGIKFAYPTQTLYMNK